MLTTLRSKMSALFLAFFLLVLLSVSVTFAALEAQKQDALVINFAGRQRMLTQKMTWLALAQPDSVDLVASIQLFDTTLNALRDGGATFDSSGNAVTLLPPPDAELRAQLDGAAQDWQSFRSHLQPVDPRALQDESPRVLARLDAIVNGFQVRADAKIALLQSIQFSSFIAALLLLAIGYILTRRRILLPLALLGSVARRIGAGQLDDPVPAMGNGEFGDLGSAFEALRAQIVMAHGQLEAEIAQRTRELESAFEFSQEIVPDLDLEHLLQSVTNRACVLTHAQAALICMLDENDTVLTLAATSGNGTLHTPLRQQVGHGLTDQVVTAGQTIVAQASCSNCAFFTAQSPRLCAAAPLRTSKTTLGAMCILRKSDEHFDAHETRALTLLANSAAIAIANARLAEEGRRQAEQAATLAERERLAGELHDNLAQTLSFLNLKTDRANEMLGAAHLAEGEKEIAQMKPAIDLAYRQVRAALVGLREPVADKATSAQVFVQQLARCRDEFHQATSIPAELKIADTSALALSSVAQTQALHIVREALTNIQRHARACHVQVQVHAADGEAHLIVQDDGIGFEPDGVNGEQHLGLAIMRARAERSGGKFAVESARGAGTRVITCFPLNGAHA